MKQVAVVFAALLLAACGFQPVYAPADGDFDAGAVRIEEIEGRSGYFLRRALRQELAAGLEGVDSATLTVDLRESLVRVPINPDQSAARTDVVASGRYVLDTGDDAITGAVRAETSFNVPLEAFSDIASQADASERAMDILARRIADDIRLRLADRDT